MRRALPCGPRGLTGAEHLAVLRLLCADFPEDTAAALLKVLGKRPDDAVDFFEFLGGGVPPSTRLPLQLALE